MNSESVNHPVHYGGKENPYEAIKVIEAWGLGFCLGNAVKYISRAGKKDSAKLVEDLEKALWYLRREIAQAPEEKGDRRAASFYCHPHYEPKPVSAAWQLPQGLSGCIENVFYSCLAPGQSKSWIFRLETAIAYLQQSISHLKGAAQ